MEIAVKPANLLKLGRHLGQTIVSVTTIEYLEALTELKGTNHIGQFFSVLHKGIEVIDLIHQRNSYLMRLFLLFRTRRSRQINAAYQRTGDGGANSWRWQRRS